ncbi:MAG TPA: spore germination protein, partial [Lachnospiraceae bacterium]|nr:spore germination protein [Lachnospiraceae bacterium]
GTYLRISRMLITLLSYIITPTFLLFMNHPEWIPKAFEFIMVKETVNIPLIFQLLILELAIDGLRLAAVNTPNMLSTPLSVLSALVIGEFSVKSGWFNAEIMLYMAFVAIANYTQSNYELGYAVKFQRILTLILTAVFGLYGYIAGIVFGLCALIFNRTIFGKGYLYPLLPLDLQRLKRRFLRLRQPRKLN